MGQHDQDNGGKSAAAHEKTPATAGVFAMRMGSIQSASACSKPGASRTW